VHTAREATVMKKVLTVGEDPILLDTRILILQKRYYTVGCNSSNALRKLWDEHFDLLLLCHSTPHESATALTKQAGINFPRLITLRLVLADFPYHQAHQGRIITHAFDPRVWFRAVEDALFPVEESHSSDR
jgi:hypothetical protein